MITSMIFKRYYFELENIRGTTFFVGAVNVTFHEYTIIYDCTMEY